MKTNLLLLAVLALYVCVFLVIARALGFGCRNANKRPATSTNNLTITGPYRRKRSWSVLSN